MQRVLEYYRCVKKSCNLKKKKHFLTSTSWPLWLTLTSYRSDQKYFFYYQKIILICKVRFTVIGRNAF